MTMKKERQIFEERRPLVVTDTGSRRVFVYTNESEETVTEPDTGDGGGTTERRMYAYDMVAITPESKDNDAILAELKRLVAADIDAYDKSSAVNEFFLGGRSMWLDDATRTRLAKRFDTDERDGKEVTRIVYEGTAYTLPIQTARGLLYQLESYAKKCFDRTNEHQATVAALGSIEAVIGYDYTTGYPPKPEFEV